MGAQPSTFTLLNAKSERASDTRAAPQYGQREIFRFDQTGVDAEGRVQGEFRSTGVRPKAMERIERYGINPADLVRPFLGE